MKSVFVILIATILLPLYLSAQTTAPQTGTIKGTVTDQKTDEPLIGANVIIDGTDRGAATDIEGNYIIRHVPESSLRLKVTYIGYNTQIHENVSVTLGDTCRLDFSLEYVPAFHTDEWCVCRPMIDRHATNTKVVLSLEDMENLPARGFLP